MKLSVIMPCYNVADTLERAIDSILMQRTDASYEVIIIDDASKDDTARIALDYADRFDNIYYLRNDVNSGNAHSFYRGLCAAKGDYFCVLDGDDYYSVRDKFEKQISFLDDDLNGEYVAVATNFVIDFGDGTVHVPNRPSVSEFTYVDLMLQHSAYLHTATYMYRNIFRNNVPEYFDMALYRGDTPRTIFHLMYSGKKVKILDFFGSVYSYTLKGIWSACNEKEHFAYQVNFFTEHKKFLRTEFEKNYAERMMELNQKKYDNVGEKAIHHYPQISIEQCLREIRRIVSKFAFKEKEYVLREIYASEYIDSLCATLGCIARTNDPELRQIEVDENVICIFISRLNPQKGGIFNEIKELVEIHADKTVYIIQTDSVDISGIAYQELGRLSNAFPLAAPPSCKDPFRWLSRKISDLAPYRAYYFCSHNDVYSPALVQDGPCQNICLFSFDHGYVVGLFNDLLDVVAAKRPVDYRLLRKYFPEKLIYLPAWGDGDDCPDYDYTYSSFANDDAITTASGAARFYKVDGEVPYRYIDLVIRLIIELGARHYHFGPLPLEVLDEVQTRLAEANVDPNRFVYIEWSSDIPADLLRYHVDLFLEPFPTVSYKLTLNVLLAGVPVAAWQSIKRMSVTDFIPADSILWRSGDELIDKLGALTAAQLESMSKNAIDYYKTHHSRSFLLPYIREATTVPIDIEAIPYYADDEIHDIADYLRLFGQNNIAVMHRYLDEKRLIRKKQQDAAVMGKQALDECKRLKRSKSFKIGCMLTQPYRNARRMLSGKQANTPCDDLRRKSPKAFVKKYGPSTALKHISEMKKSRAYRLGRVVTAPGRKIKRIMK